MGTRGPAKTPHKTLKQRESWRAGIEGRDAEPEASGEVEAPEWLKGCALAKWHDVVPDLEEMGLLGRVDSGTLARYCTIWSKWRDAEEFIDKNGSTYLLRTGLIKPHPQVVHAMKYAEQLRQLEMQFGMTPAARANVGGSIPPKEKNTTKSEIERLLNNN